MARIAVIDLGKSNSKLALVDTGTLQEERVYTTPATVQTHGHYPHLDQQTIAEFILDSLADVLVARPIDAITVTTHGATAALVDEIGELALPVMDYEFKAIDDERMAYDAIRPPFSETGSPALPGGLNLGAQLFWQQQNFPGLFAKTHAIFTWPQYWVYWLSGASFNDLTSLGCHTDLYAPIRCELSSIFSRTDWLKRMPPVSQSGRVAGTVKPELTRRIGLPAQTPVHVGIHDSNASLVPYLSGTDRQFSVLSTGTWVIAMAMRGRRVKLDEQRDSLLNVSAMGDAVPSARFMGGRERQELLDACDTKALDEQLVDNVIARLLRSQVYFMPSQVVDTGPFPQSRGVWLNSRSLLDDEDKVCAVTLYLAMMSAECLALIGAQGPTYIEGPLAHDRVFAQMLSVASGRRVLKSDSMTGTSIGAAMLVSSPESMSRPAGVDISTSRRALMQRYATCWTRQLQLHQSM